MASKSPEISIFIVHWNRPVELIASLHSLAEQTNCNLQIVVFDNGSSKENLDKLKSLLPSSATLPVTLIEGGENFGWGKALNKMLRPWLSESNPDSIKEFCAVSAHDALLNPSCIETLLQAMQTDEHIGIASPDHAGQSLRTTYSPLRGAKVIAREAPANNIEDADYAHGTLFMLRRQCLEEIGLFDERFFAYGDEADLSLRARSKNWRVVICHQAKITNPISGTSKPALYFLDARNSLLLAEIHGNKLLALLRALAICLKSLVRIFTGQDNDGIERAKLLGAQSYLFRHWGAPPANLSLWQDKPTILTAGGDD